MKILAIAGKNLASLPSFELRLDTSPLDREGLFAITGPTGAGKSTILDAMCVSLYDRMPRLPRSKTKLSEDEDNPFTNLTLSDPRHIMRRGAASCFAETTFIGVDGERYKARWEVPALQRKNAKNLKNQVISLENLDRDELFTDKKRIVQDLIIQKVGLTFDQFCRSVLLAQGDFAAFLKAGGDARAELLERMTGTEIYRDLSKAAHERARQESLNLDGLRAKMDAQSILSPEAREELNQAIETTEGQRLEAQKAWQEQQLLVVGHEKTQQLQLALHQAEQAYQAANQRVKDRESARQTLELWEKLAEAREAWLTQQRLQQKQQRTQSQHQQLLAKLPQLEAQVATVEEHLQKTDQALEAFEKQIQDQKPALDEARKCDHELETAEKTLQELTQQCLTQSQQLQHHQTRYEDLYLRADYWQEQSIASSQATQVLASFKALAQPDASWQQDLERFLMLRSEMTAACLAQSSLLLQKQDLEQTGRDQSAILTHHQTGLHQLQTALANLENEHTQQRRRDWAERYEQLQRKGQQLEKLNQIQAHLIQLQTQLEAQASQKNELQEAHTHRLATLTKLREQLPLAEVRHQEAKSHLERMVLASSHSAKDMRRQLQTGEPCPVCGATEHPFQQESVLDPLLEETRERVAQLNQEMVALRTQITQQERDANHHDKQMIALDQATLAAKDAMDEQHQLGHHLLAHFSELDEANLTAKTLAKALPALQEQWQQEKTRLDAQEQELNQGQNQLAVFRTALELARQRTQSHQTDVGHTQRRLLECGHQLEANTIRCNHRGQELTQLHARVSPSMAHYPQWQQELISQGSAFIESLKKPVQALQRAIQLLQIAEEHLQQLSPALAVAEEAVKQSLTQMDAISEKKSQAQASWQTLEHQRKGMLEGKAVAVVEAENQKQLTRLGDARKKWNQERELRLEQLNLTRTQKTQQETALQNMLEELARCQQSLHTALTANELTLEQAQPIFHKDHAWAMAKRQEIQAALATWNQAKGACEGCESQLKAHLEAFNHPGSLAEAITARDTAQTVKEQWETQAAKLLMQRETDDTLRTQLCHLKTAFETQAQKTELWESMRELIGSHDGKKFRVYAQSLTLDMLLHHANHHLKDLARRYRLERLPGADLALRIIDRDMGDEIRSVNSLSGGETFLVSLALALGLATFTTSQTPVESLFIDEGFGTLDAESLEIALDTLEALQAMGRQVGVISHVQTLVERIAAQVQVRKVGGGHSEVRVQYRQGSG